MDDLDCRFLGGELVSLPQGPQSLLCLVLLFQLFPCLLLPAEYRPQALHQKGLVSVTQPHCRPSAQFLNQVLGGDFVNGTGGDLGVGNPQFLGVGNDFFIW